VRTARCHAHSQDMVKEQNENDESQWWRGHDEAEPVMGVPSVNVAPVPLIDTADDEPEPGLAVEQEERRSSPLHP
jgi:hypothetical protein